MLGGGTRGGGGGGGFHHHHHHHGGAGAFIAGAAIGAAAMSSRNNYYAQPGVVVVSQPAVYTTTPTYTTAYPTTAYPATYTTTSYVSPPPVVVQPKRKRPLAGIIACIFLVIIIICFSVIPFPGTVSRELAYASQRVDFVDGDFVERVEASGSTGALLFAYERLPEKNAHRSYERSVAPAILYPYQYVSMEFHLFTDSEVTTQVTADDGCALQYYVFKGESRYNSFVNGGYPNWYDYEYFYGTTTHTFTVVGDDKYFVVINNPSSYCQTSVALDFNVDAISYDTTDPSYLIKTCGVPCTIDIPYPKNVYLLAQSPEEFSVSSYNINYTRAGRWYSYTFLYLGLFFGMVLCSGLANAMAKKKEREELERAPLMQPAQATGYPPVAESSAPPPYASNV